MKVAPLFCIPLFAPSKFRSQLILKRSRGACSISGNNGNEGMLACVILRSSVIGMAQAQGKEYVQAKIKINALASAAIFIHLEAKMASQQVKCNTGEIPRSLCGAQKGSDGVCEFVVSLENSSIGAFTHNMSGGHVTCCPCQPDAHESKQTSRWRRVMN